MRLSACSIAAWRAACEANEIVLRILRILRSLRDLRKRRTISRRNSNLRRALYIMSLVRCRVCQHAMRSEIEAACVCMSSVAEVAGVFGLSERALERHLATHPRGAVADEEAPVTSRSPNGPEELVASGRVPVPSLHEARTDALMAIDNLRTALVDALEAVAALRRAEERRAREAA